MSDRIFITGLSLHAYHGVMAYEAKVGQTFSIDLALEIDLSAAARSDKVVDTVSYDQVVDCASKAFCAQRFRLIEAAAGRVADAVLARFARVAPWRSPSTSRMRRSPPPSTTSASPWCGCGNHDRRAAGARR